MFDARSPKIHGGGAVVQHYDSGKGRKNLRKLRNKLDFIRKAPSNIVMSNKAHEKTHAANAVPMLEVRSIVKSFGPLIANDHVELKIEKGEIHALLGENGAGKSTLVKMLYGSLHPDSGTILWNGEPVNITSPSVARSTGIGMVFQHFSLFDSLSVADNILLSPG